MCGIYLTNLNLEKKEVLKKLKKIESRGPDNLSYERIGEVSLGHLRLSIIDLEKRSNQPFWFNDKVIVYNGEIYNFIEIRNELELLGYSFTTNSDTEVIIKGYVEWGMNILDKLNGMFSLAIYDLTKKKIFCARDRLGVKPLYYFWKDDKFEICSQLKPLINSNSKVSEEAVSIYLDCGYVPSPFSILQNVYKLSPGNYMEINLKTGEKISTEYWNLKKVQKRKISYQDAKHELHTLLKDAVKIRLNSDVPLGSFLSGGIDSALVSSIASKHLSEPLNTFTIGFNDPEYDESKIALKYSEIMGSNHSETICRTEDLFELLQKLVKVYDEPFADISALPSLYLNKITKQYVTVALSGDGGDESFLGYTYFDLLRQFNIIRFVPLVFRRILSKLPLYKIIKAKPDTIEGILTSKNSDELALKIFSGFNSLQKIKKNRWLTYYSDYQRLSKRSFQRAADLNIKLWLENDSNVKVDRASMAFSVEVRSPFLDYRIIEFARSLPIHYRYIKGKKKRILRDILSEYIPEYIFNQPKKGFILPLESWFRMELKKEIKKELNDDFLNMVPNLDVKKFKSQLNKHMKNEYDYSLNIWKIYLLSKWYKEFGVK